MDITRKTFLKTSGILMSGAALGTLPFLSSCASPEPETSPFGLQLYTLRDVIADDPEAVLRQIAEFGYKQIESYAGPMGIYWGMGNTGFKQLMDELDMTMISSHTNVFEDFERQANEAAEIGVEYLICPWIGRQETLDDYKEMADRFNQIGEQANAAGIKFAYHNHEYTFEEMDGEIPQTVLMERTEPDLVEHQMDIYWYAVAGQDAAEWIRKYPNRFTTCHVKDLVNGDNPESTILGTGTINFPELLPVAKENGMKYFIVEQEAYTGTTPMDAVRENALYMKELNI
ncbi:MAG: sugar phosphate isomerase/epimerase [Balneolaceae bacterium]|nr:MAG: sugar phosphate isomerase/epimerase [Balneolaceae bacterium]